MAAGKTAGGGPGSTRSRSARIEKAASLSTHTRVAVVQLAYHPAVVHGRRSPREDPLFDPRVAADSLLPPRGEVPEAIKPKLDALRKRIREAYDAQLLARIQAVLAACREYEARIVVFPEYSVPWEILGEVAAAAGDMVVVAGTHTVDRAARRSGVYERLSAPALPAVGQSVCPVLHGGRLLGLQAKLNPSTVERSAMRAGETWAPIAMPDGFPGPMGVLVCLDFLFREDESHRALATERLGECRFLAVPSLTPHTTPPVLAERVWEEARQYGRPVLYCDAAEGGGTSVYVNHVNHVNHAGHVSYVNHIGYVNHAGYVNPVDEEQAHDLRRFPDQAGYLEVGDEGVIITEVDLGEPRAGQSTRSTESRSMTPIAEATLVYRGHPAGEAYARWLDGARELLARDDDEALEALVVRLEEGRDVLLNAGALSGAAARARRLRRLFGELDKVTSVEEIRQFTREILVPAEVLPLGDLRAAMAAAAADVVFAWMAEREARGAGFAEVEERLRKAANVKRGAGEWTSEGAAALGAVAEAVRGAPEVDENPRPETAPELQAVLPEGKDPAALGTRKFQGWMLSFRRRPVDLRAVVDGRLRHAAVTQRPVPALNQEESLPRLSEHQIIAAETLFLLAIAEGREGVAAVGVWPEGQPASSTILVASLRDEGWVLWTDGDEDWTDSSREALRAAVAEAGLSNPALEAIPPDALTSRIMGLWPRFDGAQAVIAAFRDQRLREVAGKFVEPDAQVDGGRLTPILRALDAWLPSGEQTALVLGEFGSGRSTALAAWAAGRWGLGEGPLPLLVNLAGASPSASAEMLLLQAAGLDDVPANRAALRLLVRHRFLVPCFDGFDEMATRLEASELAGRLSGLLEIAAGGGKVIVSSRDNYFPSEAHLTTTTESALSQALGMSAGLRRLVVQPFTDDQVRDLVRQVRGEGAAAAVLERIGGIYDLKDLVHRPLLLGMVLATLDDLSSGTKVGRADLYEAYLNRWLDNTRKDDPECFTDEQKKEFAEALAEQIWRSGEPTCTWQELQRSVRARLFPLLPEGMPPGAAFLEIQGGAFFVHEGDDSYRFAHKSFLEYFLARALVATLAERPLEALRTKPITQEVAAFVGEILKTAGEPRHSGAVQAVRSFLATDRGPIDVTGEPTENALRLLLGLSRWAKEASGWIPEGADLRGAQLAGEDLRDAHLARAMLQDADLAGADLSRADLTGAALSGATLSGAKLNATILRRVTAYRADFTQAEAKGAVVEAAELVGAILRQSTWTGCHWNGARAGGADLTGCLVVGKGTPLERRRSLAATPPQVRAELLSGHIGEITTLAWAPDGKRLVSAGYDNTVRLWDAGTGKELARLEGHSNGVRAVAWHPDGERLASVGNDNTVRLWDTGTGKELARLEGHSSGVRAVAWHPAGKRLASAGDDQKVRLWDAVTGNALVVFKGHSNVVMAVAWHPTGKRLASAGGDKLVRLWDADTGKELARLEGHSNVVRAVAWHPAGKRLTSAGDDNTMRLWDASTGKALARTEGNSKGVMAVAWRPDGKRLASAGDDNMVRLWDASTGKALARLEGHSNWVRAVAWHPGGKRLASAGDDKTVRLWDAGTGKELARFEGHSNWVRTVAWHPGGKRLASAGDDNTVRLWDAETGKELARLEGHSNLIRAVAWHPAGKRLASAGDDNTVRLWEASTGEQVARLEGHSNPVRAVSWHPAGKRLASAGDDNTVRLWDAGTGKELARFDAHSNGIRAAAWHPAGKRLASAGYDQRVCIWDAGTGTELARLEGHSNWVTAVAWHPDGERLASVGVDGSVRIWSVIDGKLLASFEFAGTATLTRTAGGFCLFDDAEPDRVRLALRRPDATTALYIPLAGFRDVLHRPAKVEAALRGDLSGDDLEEELAKHGYSGGVPWDGEERFIPAGPGIAEPATLAAARVRANAVTAPPPAPRSRVAGEVRNPFRPGPALLDSPSLPGRDPIVAELFALIDSRSPAILRGPRRSGKTSILHHLAARLSPTRAVYHKTLEGRARPIRTADELAVFLAPSLQVDPAPALTLRDRLARAGNAVLLLDEVANLHEADPTVFAWLRALGQEQTSVVLVGSPWDWVSVVEHAFAAAPGSSFGNDVTPVNLGPISEADGIRFLVDTAPADVSLEADRTARWIVELCGPWPFYLQVMGYALVQAVRAGQRRALVERAGVRDLYEQRLLLDRDVTFFRARWAELPERAQRILSGLQGSPEAALPEVRQLPPDDAAVLCDAGLCDALGTWLADPPFFDWMRRIARGPGRAGR